MCVYIDRGRASAYRYTGSPEKFTYKSDAV